MNESTDQLISWFFTTAEAARMQPEGAESAYRAKLDSLRGKDRSRMSEGLKQGVNDMLTMSKHMDPEMIMEIETKLAGRGLVSLEKMMTIQRGKHRGIIRRGCIRNDEEYYLVRELLSDVDCGLTNAQRTKLCEMELAYEEEQKKP